MGWKLAELFVEISAKGFDAMSAEIDKTEKKMQVLKLAAQDAAKSTNAAFRDWAKDMLAPDKTRAAELALESMKAKTAQVGQSFKTLHSTASWAFAGITTSTLLWVRAGLQGTTVGNALAVQFQFLSREIASVFLPQIMAVVNGVRNVVVWFRNLSGEQQALIGKVIITAAAMTGLVMVLPTIISGVGTLITVWKALNVAFTASPIGAAVAVIVALAVGTEKGRAAVWKLVQSFAKLASPLASVVSSLTNFVSILAGGAVQLFVTAIEALVRLMEKLGKLWDDVVDKITKSKAAATIDPETAGFGEKLGFFLKHPLTTIEAGAAGLTGGREAANKVFRGEGEPHKSLASGHLGFESANQTYRRIAEAGLRNEMANLQREGNGILTNIAGIVEGIQNLMNRGAVAGGQLIGP